MQTKYQTAFEQGFDVPDTKKRQIFHTPLLSEIDPVVDPVAAPVAEPVDDEPQGGGRVGDAGAAADAPAVAAPDRDPAEGAAPPVALPSFVTNRRTPRLSGATRDVPGPVVKPAKEASPGKSETAEEKAARQAARKVAKKADRALKQAAKKTAESLKSPAIETEKPAPAAKKAPKPKLKKGPEIVVPPVAAPAKMRGRHWGVVMSLIVMVILPFLVVAWYMWFKAIDQYASTVGFTVSSEEGGGAAAFAGGLGELIGGGATQKDTDILFEYLQSQGVVMRMQDRFDINGLYSKNWEADPVFSIWPDATIEELLWYWKRIVSVSYDQSSGLMDMRVQAFDPDTAQALAKAVLEESQALINQLNADARNDKLRYAQEDLEQAVERLKEARGALTVFQTRTQILNPLTDLEGAYGVQSSLQGQLAQAFVEHDLLLEQTSVDDPRLVQARRKIEVIQARIAQERADRASGEVTAGAGDESYPALLAEFAGLQVDAEFAEEGYRGALIALDVARTNAARESRYLSAFVTPTLPQTAQYPRRLVTVALAGLFLILIWSTVILIYYSVRDSK